MTDLHQINDKLLEIIGSLGAAEMQASACDDQIIMGHLRDAYRDTIALRRQVFAVVRARALSELAALDGEIM